MRAAPFSAEGNGAGTIEALLWPEGKGGGGPPVEPTSVLDCRRSPSPPYSTSTLSSSAGGAAGDSSSGVAAVSENSAAAAEATKWTAPGEHGGAGGGGGRKDEWAGGELPPIPGTLDAGFVGEEGWDAMMLRDAAAAAGQEQTFLNWIMAAPGDMEPPPLQHHQLLGNAAGFGFQPSVSPLGFSLQHHPGGDAGAGALASDLSSPCARSLTPTSSGSSSKATSAFGLMPTEAVLHPATMPFHGGADIKPPLLGVPSASLLLNQHQHQPSPATSFMPLPSFPDHQHHQPHLPPPPKRHHSMPDNLFLLHNQLQPPPQQQHGLPFPPLHTAAPFQLQPSLQPRGAMKTAAAAQQQQQLLDELAAAAEAAEVGNSIGAREILARLNQQLPQIGKPFLRSASYLKEALLLALADGPHSHGSARLALASPLDVALKLTAYKSFSDLSPVLQFANFTATQALLDEISCTTSSCIRIIDFDLGVGGQWASFLQELAYRRGTGSVSMPMLKLTAFVSDASHHPLELHLTQENLSQFAVDLGIPFEFNAINLDALGPAQLITPTADEVVAVCLPVGCSARTPPLPMLLRLVKQFAPKIAVAIDHGSDRGDLPFSQHFMNCFHSCMLLLDSLDAAATDADAVNKIEKFLIQPRVEDAILGRHRAEKAMAWRTVFKSAGFAPVPLSNLAEAQADCLLKRVQVRGFHVEKCAMGLALYWQHGELVSVSAWRC